MPVPGSPLRIIPLEIKYSYIEWNNSMILKIIFTLLCAMVLFGCSTPKELRTDSIPPVANFDLQRYLGKWYEIARLPHSFEDGLDNVTASYSLRNDGDIRVINRGFDTENKEWSDAEGRAWVPEPSAPSVLKVSFFWPFSASYKVILLAEDYSYAMVTSSSKDYLWILARQPTIDDSLYSSLVDKAKVWGFDIEKLIKVVHDKSSSGS